MRETSLQTEKTWFLSCSEPQPAIKNPPDAASARHKNVFYPRKSFYEINGWVCQKQRRSWLPVTGAKWLSVVGWKSAPGIISNSDWMNLTRGLGQECSQGYFWS